MANSPIRVLIRVILGAGLVLGVNGCMTTVTQIMYFTGDKNVEDKWMVYIGTRGNCLLIATAVSEGPFKPVGHGSALGIYGFLDFPLSLALDTALLPVTVVETIVDALNRPAGKSDRDSAENELYRGGGKSSSQPEKRLQVRRAAGEFWLGPGVFPEVPGAAPSK